jgi:hypothetical protein
MKIYNLNSSVAACKTSPVPQRREPRLLLPATTIRRGGIVVGNLSSPLSLT